MPRPTAKPALAKAPHREHPAAPPIASEEPANNAKPTGAQKAIGLTMYSARIETDLAINAKMYAIRTRTNLQKLTEAALTEYMHNHPSS